MLQLLLRREGGDGAGAALLAEEGDLLGIADASFAAAASHFSEACGGGAAG